MLYPLSRSEFGLLPEAMRITTSKLAERRVISPLLLAGLAYFARRDAGGPALTAPRHLAGRLSGPVPSARWPGTAMAASRRLR